MTAHAPSVGYSFPEKEKYRSRLWSWIDAQFKHKVPARKRVVAFLDAKEGLETRFLLGKGYAAQNLHAINFSPAEVAVLTRGLKADGLPAVKTHGIDFVRTIREAGVSKWNVMSFDGCGPVGSKNTLRCIKAMASMASPGTILSANVLAGRDSGETSALLRRAKASGRRTHDMRFQWMERAFTTRIVDSKLISLWKVAERKRGTYLSASGQLMLWCAVRIAHAATSDALSALHPNAARNASHGRRLSRGGSFELWSSEAIDGAERAFEDRLMDLKDAVLENERVTNRLFIEEGD